MVESCRQPLTTLSFSMLLSFPSSLALFLARMCARSMCIRDRGASLGVARIDEGPLIIVPSLRQDESCICIPAPLSFIRSLSLSFSLIRSSYLSPSCLPFSLSLTLFFLSGGHSGPSLGLCLFPNEVNNS